MCHIHSVKQQSNLYLLTKNTKQKHQFFYEYPIFVGIQTYLPRKFIQYCNFTAHFVHSNIGLSMLSPYYIAVDSTPNRDVSKRSKKSKQNARSKWDNPGFLQCTWHWSSVGNAFYVCDFDHLHVFIINYSSTVKSNFEAFVDRLAVRQRQK
jgi:hypothetical protein